ncbi:antirestriction family protein, partial [Clostridioides difficile]
MQETRVLVETKRTTGEETTSYWFDLPIEVAEFEEKLGVSTESQDYRIIEKLLPYADEVHEHTSVYQLNELDYMYRQLSSDMQEEYTMLHTVYENLEALYICRNVITLYPDCKSMIDVARQKLM